MIHLKHIPLEGAHNFRDLGGYPTADGRMTSWGRLYRSDALSGLTKADWNLLQARQVKTILDLRSSNERTSSPIQAPDGVEILPFSLMNTLDGDPRSMSQETILQSMKLDYTKTLFGNLSCAADILKAILSRLDKGAVVFLCSAGKDRTGIVAALLLTLCRVGREDILADYMVSSTYNANGINKKFENLPEAYRKMIPDLDLLKECLASKPETMAALLDSLDQQDIRSRLTDHGFGPEAQQALAAKCTEAIPL